MKECTGKRPHVIYDGEDFKESTAKCIGLPKTSFKPIKSYFDTKIKEISNNTL